MHIPAQDRYRLFALMIVGSIIGQVSAQFIVAGELGANDHYQDPEPDLNRALFLGGTEGDPFDMDNNGSVDVMMIAWRDGIISPHYNADVHLSFGADVSIATGVPGCGYTAARRFVTGDTIDGAATWSSSPVGVLTRVEGSECPYWGQPNFIGVRLAHANDTLYGWIRMQASSSPQYTVFDLACNSSLVGLPHADKPASWYGYDAGRGELSIRPGPPVCGAWSVEVCDVQGRRVSVKTGEGGTQRIKVSLNELTVGVYVFSMRTNAGLVLGGRFVVVGDPH